LARVFVNATVQQPDGLYNTLRERSPHMNQFDFYKTESSFQSTDATDVAGMHASHGALWQMRDRTL
jgi:hypothetical protein